MLWDLNEGKHLYSLEAGDIVNALVFSPNRYWLCAATAACIKIFDLESKYVSPIILIPLRGHNPDYSTRGRSSTSSSRTLRRTPARGSPSVSRWRGPPTARRCSVGSRTTSSVCGPSRHERTGYRCHRCSHIAVVDSPTCIHCLFFALYDGASFPVHTHTIKSTLLRELAGLAVGACGR